jgi:hypothetical protein
MVAPPGRRQRGVIDMDNPTDTLDQADEEILTYTASDEALEAAAGTVENTFFPYCTGGWLC